jgi:hypothetical protein
LGKKNQENNFYGRSITGIILWRMDYREVPEAYDRYVRGDRCGRAYDELFGQGGACPA